jgi:hypothetical protein
MEHACLRFQALLTDELETCSNLQGDLAYALTTINVFNRLDARPHLKNVGNLFAWTPPAYHHSPSVRACNKELYRAALL